MDYGNVMEDEGAGPALALLEGGGDTQKRIGGLSRVRRGRRAGGQWRGRRSKEGGNLEGAMREARVIEGVVDDGPRNSGAGDIGEGGEGTQGDAGHSKNRRPLRHDDL